MANRLRYSVQERIFDSEPQWEHLKGFSAPGDALTYADNKTMEHQHNRGSYGEISRAYRVVDREDGAIVEWRKDTIDY